MKHTVYIDGIPMRKLEVPRANLNGNSEESLVSHCIDIRKKIRELLDTMQKGTADLAHGRNFLHKEDTMHSVIRAADAWRDRYLFLNQLYQELEELAIAIQDGKEEME